MEKKTALAFNDAWVERASGQTAWIQVKVNGQERLAQLVADGALVATAAGSTSYARAMGGPPLPLNTPALLLVGSNVLKPKMWQPVVLPPESSIELTNLEPARRPICASAVPGQVPDSAQPTPNRTAPASSVGVIGF